MSSFIFNVPNKSGDKWVKRPDAEPDSAALPSVVYCAGEKLPQEAVSTVKVYLTSGEEKCYASCDVLPEDIEGFVIYNPNNNQMKFVSGRMALNSAQVSDIASELVAEYAANDTDNDTVRSDEEILAVVDIALQTLPEFYTDAQAKVVAQACIDAMPPDQVRTDAEILTLVNAVIANLVDEVRTDAEIKAIALDCYQQSSADFVTRSEIYSYIAEEIAELPADTVRSDAEIKTISQACFDTLIEQYEVTPEEIKDVVELCLAQQPSVRTDAEINLLIETKLAALPQDQVRSDAEIKVVALQCFETQDVLTEAEIRLLVLEYIANSSGGLSESQVQMLIDASIADIEFTVPRSDQEIKDIAQTCAQSIVDALPGDQVRTDAEIKSIAEACTIAIVAALPADQVRTDAEIAAIAQGIVDALPADQVRTDSEIKTIAEACAQAIVDALPADQVRTDAEIKAIAQTCADAIQVRTDAEITALVQAYVDSLPNVDTPRTDAEIKTIAQQCINDNPDLVRSDAEILTIVQGVVDALPPDTVRSDSEIKAIAEQCIGDIIFACTEITDPDAPCFSYGVITVNGAPITDATGAAHRFQLYKTPTSFSVKRCFRNLTGTQLFRVETALDGGYTVEFGAPDADSGDTSLSGDNSQGIISVNYGTEPVTGCVTITFDNPCDEVSVLNYSEDFLDKSEPSPTGSYSYE